MQEDVYATGLQRPLTSPVVDVLVYSQATDLTKGRAQVRVE